MADFNFNEQNQKAEPAENPIPLSSNQGELPTALVNGKLVTEPFRWLSVTDRPHPGVYKIDMSTPKNVALLGSFSVIAGIALGIFSVLKLSVESIILGIFLFIIFDGLGIALIIIAYLRHRWFKAYFKK